MTASAWVRSCVVAVVASAPAAATALLIEAAAVVRDLSCFDTSLSNDLLSVCVVGLVRFDLDQFGFIALW